MLAIGIDPDLHDTGIALISDGHIVMVGAAHVPTKLKGSEAVVAMAKAISKAWHDTWHKNGGPQLYSVVIVEGQQKYKNSAARPEDLIKVAQVAGSALAEAIAYTECPGFIPTPQEWKGSVPKGIHQARILKDFNIPYTFLGKEKGAVPAFPLKIRGGEDLTRKQWHAVVDAIGLAQWGLAEVKRQESRARRLRSIDESAGIVRGPDGLPSSMIL